MEPLPHPNAQATQYQLVTDASQHAVGGALNQMINGEALPMAFFSKKLSTPQRAYSTFDRELLAAYISVIHFKHFIDGRKVLLLSDHKPLIKALKNVTEAKSDR